MHMPEIPVIVSGNVFRYLPTTDFETKQPTGAKVAILSDAGATEVKFSQEDVLAGLAPTVGENVALQVEPRAWKMGNNSGVSFSYRGPVTGADLDALAAIVGLATSSSK